MDEKYGEIKDEEEGMKDITGENHNITSKDAAGDDYDRNKQHVNC